MFLLLTVMVCYGSDLFKQLQTYLHTTKNKKDGEQLHYKDGEWRSRLQVNIVLTIVGDSNSGKQRYYSDEERWYCQDGTIAMEIDGTTRMDSDEV